MSSKISKLQEEAADNKALLDNSITCGVCGAHSFDRHELLTGKRIPLSWWAAYNWWLRHGMGKACKPKG